ncbi:unnamed protein product [Nezara viridula]|uniref:PDZ domain-containing protein n=1 Tax=Nezara viridula TaxID=85310 RepID=A0A9P0E627_NEZVI|nr:unnamed protein product [Nezara viridula]
MCEELHLERLNNRVSWGFRLTGGLDFGTPLSIIKVIGGSVAELGGVQVGDLVQEINGQQTKNFTHTDAQNCIAKAQNHLRLLVLRGSLVTPPLTPLRGMTPEIGYTENSHYQNSINNADLNERLANSTGDGFKNAPITQQKIGSTATMSKPKYSVNEKGQLLAGDRILSDVEIAELITSNEEVLDEGVLGINFKKFLPQVDFIRKSEVFKLLQNENTKKEIPEHIQLKKDPNKRFSTFLQKPSIPKESPGGPKFLHFKPPRFLPKQPEKKFEWPVLKPWQRPKKPTPEPPVHSVLWLFLEEKGEEIIGGRWGSDAEERENLSRNSFVEFDRDSMCSSMKLHDEDSASVTSKEFGRESQMSRIDESLNETEEALNGTATAQAESDIHEDQSKLQYSWYIEQQEGDISEIRESMMEANKEITDIKKTITDERDDIYDDREEMQFEEGYYAEDIEQKVTADQAYNKNVVNNDLLSQLYQIQYQIEALENEVTNDVQTQLHAVKEQISKIVDAKASHSKTYQVEEEQFEAQFKGNLKTGEKTMHYETLNAPNGKEIRGVVGNKEIISRNSAIHEESSRTVQENVKSDVVSSESVNKKGNITETVEETIETFEAEISEHQEYETTQVEIEGFKVYVQASI